MEIITWVIICRGGYVTDGFWLLLDQNCCQHSKLVLSHFSGNGDVSEKTRDFLLLILCIPLGLWEIKASLAFIVKQPMLCDLVLVLSNYCSIRTQDTLRDTWSLLGLCFSCLFPPVCFTSDCGTRMPFWLICVSGHANVTRCKSGSKREPYLTLCAVFTSKSQ